ncbi:hypothetical protein DMENIID0001_023410 [Sergentomyia squamirostris]
MAKRIDRVEALRLITEKKEILFGRFSATLTHEERRERGMRETGCHEPPYQGSVLAKLAQEDDCKRDGMSKTDTAGGKRQKLDADEIILDIVGRDSAQIVRINLPEASRTQIRDHEASAPTPTTSSAHDVPISRKRRLLDILSSPPPSPDNLKFAGPSSSRAQPQRPGPKPGIKAAVDKYTAAYMKARVAQDMAITPNIFFDDDSMQSYYEL